MCIRNSVQYHFSHMNFTVCFCTYFYFPLCFWLVLFQLYSSFFFSSSLRSSLQYISSFSLLTLLVRIGTTREYCNWSFPHTPRPLYTCLYSSFAAALVAIFFLRLLLALHYLATLLTIFFLRVPFWRAFASRFSPIFSFFFFL